MQQLFMQEKIFSWRDRFTVWDVAGNDRYYVEGELFSWGKKLHVYDVQDREVAYIQQRLLSFLPRFDIFVDGEQTAQIVKEFSFFHPRYTVEGLGWDVDGSFWEHDYAICQNGVPVAEIHKQWMSWGDCYSIDIADNQDEVTALAVVLAIDCVQEQTAAAANT